MKKLTTILALFSILTLSIQATDHTIGAVGVSYTPPTLEVQIGDNVTIQASSTHPTTQVSEATWNADGTTPVGGGWGTETSQFSFTVTSFNTIYFVCDNHIDQGMKGQITVTAATGVEEDLNKIGFEVLGNPVRNSLNYRMASLLSDQTSISFFDLKGTEVVRHQLIAVSGSIPLEIPAGQYLYVIRSKSEELLSTGRIVLAE